MDDDDNYEVLIKLVILGDIAVGKTNFLCRFVDNEFNIVHVSTVGFDFKSRICDITKVNKKVKFQIWDTAGQEKYMSINKNLFQRVQGIMLMYDISNEESFNHLNKWIEHIKENSSGSPVILIGNKSDLENNRQVSKQEGEAKAKNNGIAFLETSALDGNNIELAFQTLVEEIYDKCHKDFEPVAVVDIGESKTLSLEEKKQEEQKKGGCC